MKKLLLCGVVVFCTTLHAEDLTSINDTYRLSNPNDTDFSRINWSSNKSFSDLGPNKGVPTGDALFQLEIKKREIERKDALCKAAFDMARNIMYDRQNGVSKASQLQANLQTPYRSPEYTKYQVYLINKAYDEPAYEKTVATYNINKEFAYKSFFECKKSVYSLIP